MKLDYSIIKAGWNLMTGGVTGLVKYFLSLFNVQVLGKIDSKETGFKYLKDVQAVNTLIKAILENHADSISPAKKECGLMILEALDKLAKALEDFDVTEDELTAIINSIKAAIDAWKAVK